MMAVFLAGFLGLLISHFTTNQIFGITYYTVFIPLYFWITDIFIRGTGTIRTKEQIMTIKKWAGAFMALYLSMSGRAKKYHGDKTERMVEYATTTFAG